ncbi:hypothetical protein [Phytohabitans suffuscus]|uniref:Uncharacterized protein n=1 Tax=Phytohabitans suffuscus TaxID=624315 RepID=A0A6F8Z027_9ACTN|nr:hypothetical protein [Phytohabitans suffuscus]BCB91785.1 hypothetical protein Psuf_090980 [Phytohabitans suffuscus]
MHPDDLPPRIRLEPPEQGLPWNLLAVESGVTAPDGLSAPTEETVLVGVCVLWPSVMLIPLSR